MTYLVAKLRDGIKVEEQNASNRNSGTKVNGVTFADISMTVDGLGSNRLMIVTTVGDAVADNIVRNSQFFTPFQNESISGLDSEIWYLVNPSVGTFDLRFNGTSGSDVVFGATTYINVNQITPIAGAQFDSNIPGTSVSVSDTVAINEMFIACFGAETTSGITPGGSQTEIWRRDVIGITGSMSQIQGNGGSTAISYTHASANDVLVGGTIKVV